MACALVLRVTAGRFLYCYKYAAGYVEDETMKVLVHSGSKCRRGSEWVVETETGSDICRLHVWRFVQRDADEEVVKQAALVTAQP